MEALAESHKLQLSLDEERNTFLPLAETGATLYFVIKALSKVNCMYAFSLNAFLDIFKQALEADSQELKKSRIQFLSSKLKILLYENICRSLFKSDRLMFAIHLIHGMHPEMFKEKEFEIFSGTIVSENMLKRRASLPNKYPEWIASDMIPAISLIDAELPEVYRHLSLNDDGLWKHFMSSNECELEIPRSVTAKLTAFQQVLLIQALRPDRLVSSMNLFSQRALGVRELSPPVVNLKRLYHDYSKSTEPILILISPGADVSQELKELADSVVGESNYVQVSMGQGQSEHALSQLKECSLKGKWLCLMNLHLVIAWVQVLEKEINALTPHKDFRLWLTSEPHRKFPVVLLESSLKVTYESPPGIKKNMMRTYEAWSPQFIEKSRSTVRAQALFFLAWFHAIIQERRNYIPQGWTKFYEFSNADLRAGADIIDRLCSGTGNIQWEFIHGLFENAVFGGRIDNNYDLQVLRAYLQVYFDRELIGTNKRHKIANIDVPNSVSHKEYVNTLAGISDYDSPALFHLPLNIDRSQQIMVAKNVISLLKIVKRSNTEDHAFDKAKWTTELSPYLHLWKKLNIGSDLVKLPADQIPVPHEKDPPLMAFLLLERHAAVKLVQKVHNDLSKISKVIRGTSLITTDVQENATKLLRQEVPLAWWKKWEGPMSPFQWLRSLMSKTVALGGWVTSCKEGTLLKQPADLSELFYPDVFLNALRQETARQLQVPINDLVFTSSWGGRISSAVCSVSVEGLAIEGALFEGTRLVECKRDSPMSSPVPQCTVAWIRVGEMVPQHDCIECPIYYSPDREKLVSCLAVPCSGTPREWVLRSVAFVLKDQY